MRASEIEKGIFFVGLGILFLTGWWWPGIMLVIAAAILGRTVANGQPWQSATGALWLIGIAVIFGIPGFIGGISGAFWDLFPLILVGLGLFMLFGRGCWPRSKGQQDDDKRKHKPKNDEDGDIHHV